MLPEEAIKAQNTPLPLSYLAAGQSEIVNLNFSDPE